MTFEIELLLRSARRATAVLGYAWLGASAAHAADLPIYKCAGSHGAVLYTDHPCEGGEALDIRPGRADPDAATRLEAARREIAQGVARIRADEALTAARREELVLMRSAAEAAPYAGAPFGPPVESYGLVGGYGGYVGGVPPHLRRHPRAERGSAHGAKPPVRNVGRVPAQIRRPRAPG
jgi:hypothetical protein